MTPEQEKLLREIHNALFDLNGRKGLFSQVTDNTKAINRIHIALAAILAVGGGSGYALIAKILGG